MKTIKKTISTPCPCCKQRWTRDIDVPAPVDGITFLVVQEDTDKIDLTIEYHDVIDSSLNGDTDVLTDLTFNDVVGCISVFAQTQHRDNTYMKVESNIMDTLEVRKRRFSIDSNNIKDALNTLRKAYRQSRMSTTLAQR